MKCPRCSALLPTYVVANCPNCGLSLSGPDAMELGRIDMSLGSLEQQLSAQKQQIFKLEGQLSFSKERLQDLDNQRDKFLARRSELIEKLARPSAAAQTSAVSQEPGTIQESASEAKAGEAAPPTQSTVQPASTGPQQTLANAQQPAASVSAQPPQSKRLGDVHYPESAVSQATQPFPYPRPSNKPQFDVSSFVIKNLLLIAGAVLLTIGAIVFTVITWSQLGVGVKTAIIGAVTIVALTAPVLLTKRNLRSTAEAIYVVAAALLALDAFSARKLGLFNLDQVHYGIYIAVAAALIAAVSVTYRVLWELKGSGYIALVCAQIIVPAAVLPQIDGSEGIALVAAVNVALNVMLIIAAPTLLKQSVSSLSKSTQGESVTAITFAAIWLGLGSLSLAIALAVETTYRWPVFAAAALFAGTTISLRFLQKQLVNWLDSYTTGVVLGLGFMLGLRFGSGDYNWHTATITALALAIVAIGISLLDAREHRYGLHSAAAVPAVGVGIYAVLFAGLSFAFNITWLSDIWGANKAGTTHELFALTRARGGGTAGQDGIFHAVMWDVLLVGALAIAFLLWANWSRSLLPGLAVMSTVIVLQIGAAFNLPWIAVISVEASLAIVALALGWLARNIRIMASLLIAGGVLSAHVLLWSLAHAETTLVVYTLFSVAAIALTGITFIAPSSSHVSETSARVRSARFKLSFGTTVLAAILGAITVFSYTVYLDANITVRAVALLIFAGLLALTAVLIAKRSSQHHAILSGLTPLVASSAGFMTWQYGQSHLYTFAAGAAFGLLALGARDDASGNKLYAAVSRGFNLSILGLVSLAIIPKVLGALLFTMPAGGIWSDPKFTAFKEPAISLDGHVLLGLAFIAVGAVAVAAHVVKESVLSGAVTRGITIPVLVATTGVIAEFSIFNAQGAWILALIVALLVSVILGTLALWPSAYAARSWVKPANWAVGVLAGLFFVNALSISMLHRGTTTAVLIGLMAYTLLVCAVHKDLQVREASAAVTSLVWLSLAAVLSNAYLHGSGRTTIFSIFAVAILCLISIGLVKSNHAGISIAVVIGFAWPIGPLFIADRGNYTSLSLAITVAAVIATLSALARGGNAVSTVFSRLLNTGTVYSLVLTSPWIGVAGFNLLKDTLLPIQLSVWPDKAVKFAVEGFPTSGDEALQHLSALVAATLFIGLAVYAIAFLSALSLRSAVSLAISVAIVAAVVQTLNELQPTWFVLWLGYLLLAGALAAWAVYAKKSGAYSLVDKVRVLIPATFAVWLLVGATGISLQHRAVTVTHIAVIFTALVGLAAITKAESRTYFTHGASLIAVILANVSCLAARATGVASAYILVALAVVFLGLAILHARKRFDNLKFHEAYILLLAVEAVLLAAPHWWHLGLIWALITALVATYAMTVQPKAWYAAMVGGWIAVWSWLQAGEIYTIDAYTLPVAAGLLAMAALLWRKKANLTSWQVEGPGLLFLFIPSLLVLLFGSESHRIVDVFIRPLLLGLLALAVTLIGGHYRRQAAVVTGFSALIIVGLHELSPVVTSVLSEIPRWIPITAGGLLLIIIGATYEKRIQQARALGDKIRSMN